MAIENIHEQVVQQYQLPSEYNGYHLEVAKDISLTNHKEDFISYVGGDDMYSLVGYADQQGAHFEVEFATFDGAINHWDTQGVKAHTHDIQEGIQRLLQVIQENKNNQGK